MIKKSTLNRLKEFGLNSYEARIWAALLLKGSANAGTLSEMADVPRSRCYDVLESLEKKGFIIARLGRPITYLAVSPEEAVDRVKTHLENDTQEQMSALEALKTTDTMKELNALHSSGIDTVAPEELTGVIKHKKNIDSHLSTMLKDAKQEILLAADSTELEGKISLLAALAKGVDKPRVRILTSEGDEKFLSSLSKYAEVKTVQDVGRFCVTDKGAALFLTNGVDEASESALWVNAPPVVQSLRSLFEAKWANV